MTPTGDLTSANRILTERTARPTKLVQKQAEATQRDRALEELSYQTNGPSPPILRAGLLALPCAAVNERLRELPSVDEVLARPAVRALESRVGHAAARAAVRGAIAEARARLVSGASPVDGSSGVAGSSSGPGESRELVSDAAVVALAEREAAPRLRRVINATGVVLHTNLGRAPLHPEVIARVAAVASGYSNLELDLATGLRGSRSAHVEPLLCELFSAEAAHVVNNCAGATLLALAALGSARAVIVSRGELVEIGGGFRVPEILEQSGCRLVEVGTTNRTRIADFARALEANPNALLLRVHRSNFALVGFTEEATVRELADLAHSGGTFLLHDLGSGALNLPAPLTETTAAQSLREGADLVLVSGDKLLGGPQAGLLLGKRDLVDRCRRHPLSRALRADKMLLAALEATLQLHRQGRSSELPAHAAMGAQPEELSRRATLLALRLQEAGVPSRVTDTEGQIGGGSLPLARLPGKGVAVDGPANELLASLREAQVPVVALARGGGILLDVRCVTDAETGELASAVAAARAGLGPARRAAWAEGATLEES